MKFNIKMVNKNDISYTGNFILSLCYALKAWIACLFFLMQSVYPDTFTCISVGIIKDMAQELEIKTIHTSTNIEENKVNCKITTSTSTDDKTD